MDREGAREQSRAPDSERRLSQVCSREDLGHLRFVPTHGAVESDSLNSSATSQESVAPPSATRGLPGTHF